MYLSACFPLLLKPTRPFPWKRWCSLLARIPVFRGESKGCGQGAGWWGEWGGGMEKEGGDVILNSKYRGLNSVSYRKATRLHDFTNWKTLPLSGPQFPHLWNIKRSLLTWQDSYKAQDNFCKMLCKLWSNPYACVCLCKRKGLSLVFRIFLADVFLQEFG